MKFAIKVDVWKNNNKYGEPDENKTVGEYYSEDAAKVDVEMIKLRLMCVGYQRIQLEIIVVN